jgi:plastocyanin
MRTAPRRLAPSSSLSRSVSVALLVAAGAARAEGEARGQIVGERVFPGVVYADDLPEELAPKEARATMRQLNLKFLPQILPVLQGTTVDFKNEDATAHNVFSASPPPFDLGTFGDGTRSFLFRAPGAHVILCNVHLEMVAWVLVVRNPFFTSVAEDGRFSLKLPAGRHRLVLWRPRERDVATDVDVPGEGRTEVEWVLSRQRP